MKVNAIKQIRTPMALLLLPLIFLIGILPAHTQAQQVGALNYVHMPDTTAANGQHLCYPVYLFNGDTLDFVCVPLTFTPGVDVVIDSVSTAGSRIEGLGVITKNLTNEPPKFFVDFNADSLTPLLPGDGLLMKVYITIDQNATAQNIIVGLTTIPPNVAYKIMDVNGNDVATPIDEGLIQVTTHVPEALLEPDEFWFTAVIGVNPPSQAMSITNIGEDPLNWQIADLPGWIIVSPTSGTAPSSVDITPDVTGLALGTYVDSFSVYSELAVPKKKWATVHLEVVEEPVEVTRCIDLVAGWNLISWDVDTPSDDIETIIADIKGCIDAIFGFEAGAATYDPDLPQFSTLSELDHLHGYWFRMECDTVLCVTGMAVPDGTPIELEENWNLVSYLPDGDLAPIDALASVHDDLIVVLGFNGTAQTYDPNEPTLSDLDFLSPHFGYWLKTSASGTLTYPGLVPLVTDPFAGADFKAVPQSGVIPTPEWIDMYGEGIILDGELVPAGSMIEVFDEDGNLCGSATVEQGGVVKFTPIYFDLGSTPVDEGTQRGGRVNFSVNGQPVNEDYQIEQFGQRLQLGQFTSLQRTSAELPTDFVLKQNFPNPFNPATLIEFNVPKTEFVSLEVFNLLGERVNTLVNRSLPVGSYGVTWNGDDSEGNVVPSGIYFYRLTAGDFTETKKMMLVK